MAVELFNNGKHACLAFYDLVDEEVDHAVQCNQFLIVDGEHGALIDPGGNMTYNGLLMSMQRFFPSRGLDYIFATHADPDIIASLNKWMVSTHCKVMISRLWTRFIPHFTTGKDYTSRILGIPDEGMNITLGDNKIKAVPAHFMHSEGNFQFYDPVSRILFTGDLGVSMMSGAQAAKPVTDFKAHIPLMEGFHKRYMVSNKIMRLWAQMARQLDISMIVPQHGAPIMGAQAISDFINWIEGLTCGIDLFDDRAYQLPSATIDPVVGKARPTLRPVTA